MSDFNVDLEQLDDIDGEIDYNPETYRDQTGPIPQLPGDYRFRVEEGGLRRNKEGELVLDNGYPMIEIRKATIVEPEELSGRTVFPYQSFSLRPVAGGPRAGSVPAIDLLRGFDDSVPATSSKAVIAALTGLINEGRTFVAGSSWEGKDTTFIKDTLVENGVDNASELDAETRKAMFKAAILRGTKSFQQNGFLVGEVPGPSGEPVQARFKLSRIYPSSKEVKKLGTYKLKTGGKDKE